MSKQIKFIEPHTPHPSVYIEDLKSIHNSGIHSNMGPYEKRFEKKISKYLDSKGQLYSSVVSNATMGLLLATKATFKDSGYVLLPSFTFAATIEAVLWNNLTPVFVDIDQEYWSMLLDKNVRTFIRKNDIAGIIYCNPFGMAGNIDPWLDISNSNGIPIIVDSAAGIGSKYSDGDHLGTKADAEIFSLHITKTFAVGEGGIVTTKNQKLFHKLQMKKNFGFDNNHEVNILGINAKLPESGSAIALHILKEFNSYKKQKKHLVSKYLSNLDKRVVAHPNIQLSYPQFYPAVFKTIAARKRAENSFKKDNIGYRRYYYPPLHKHKAFEKIQSTGNLDNTNYIAERILALPMHFNLTDSDLGRITNAVNISL